MLRIPKVGNVMGGILLMLLCILPPIEIEAQEEARTTGIFVVTGTITRDNAPVEAGLQVTVRNRSTGVALSDKTGESAGAGGYVVTFSDLTENRAAAVGDQIEVSVFDREGNMLDRANQAVTADEIAANLLRIDITLAEKVPPKISAVSASWITSTFVLITWTTDEPSSSVVEYGATRAYGHSATGSDLLTSHSVTVTELSPSTTYHYRVGSTDESGNTAWSGDDTFTTSMARGAEQATGIFVVTGTITRDGFPVKERLDVRVRNGTTGAEHADRTGRIAGVGGYVVTFSDLGDNRAAAVGDEIGVSVVDREGKMLGATSHTVAADEIAVSLIRIDVDFGTETVADTQPPRMISLPEVVSRTDEAVTVVWTTDELSDSRVGYGLEESYGSEAGSSEYVREHRIRLTGLTAETAYHLRVASTDPSGNTMGSSDFTFRTKAAPDVSPPRILTGPAPVFRDHHSAVIEWTTDELSDSGVDYGETSAYGTWEGSEERVRVHRVSLRYLTPSTEVHFRVRSVDPSENTVESADHTFRTKATPDQNPPVILKGPAVVARTHNSATIGWITDEPSDTWVDYGETSAYGRNQGAAGDARVHIVVLTNLSPGTEYLYRVASSDPNGNGPTYGTGKFVTPLEPDEDPPVILSGPMVYWTDRLATVAWRTDERSTSAVYFGTPQTYRTDQEEKIAGDDSGEPYVTNHNVTLTGLMAGKQYYFRMESVDLEGNVMEFGKGVGSAKRAKAAKRLQPPGWEGDFTTNSYADTQIPVILSGPGVTFKNDSRVTIEWGTDERSDSVVEYAIDNGGAGKIVAGETFPHREEWAEDLLAHAVTLTNLEPGMLIHYRVGSTDPSGNGATWSAEGVVQTDQMADTEAPRIVSGPEVLLRTDRSVVIAWDTDEPGDSVVEVGLDTTYGSERNELEDVTGHRITLTNLAPSTWYHYRVGTTDPSGNGPTWSADGLFETQAEPDEVAPQILSGPAVVSKTDGSVIIEWVTDELADSYVKYGEEVSYGFNVGSVEDVSNHRVELTNLKAGTTYHYHVGSIDRSGNGPTESADFSFVTDAEPDTEAPVSPSGLSVKWKENRVALSWTANPEPDVVGYNVYRREESEELGELIVTLVSGVEYVDGGVTAEKQYGYRITAVDGSGNESMPSSDAMDAADMEVRVVPEEYGLEPNFPNPFNSSTSLRYQLPREGEVVLSIYNMLGQRVRTLVEARREVGFYHVRWDGRDRAGKALASGIYFCRLQVGNFVQTRSMVILQ